MEILWHSLLISFDFGLIVFLLNKRALSLPPWGFWSAKVGQVRVWGNISDWFCQQIDARKDTTQKKVSRSLFLKHAENVMSPSRFWSSCSFAAWTFYLIFSQSYKLVENTDITLLRLRNFPPNEALLLSLQSIFLNLVSGERALKKLVKN